MRRLVEHHGAGLFSQLLKARLAPFLLRQEAFEAELVAGQTRPHQRRHKGRSTGQAGHLDACLDGLACYQKPRIADSRSSGITDHGHLLTSQQALHNTLHRLVFVELVVGLQRTLNVEMLQEEAARPSVFRKNQIHLAQYL